MSNQSFSVDFLNVSLCEYYFGCLNCVGSILSEWKCCVFFFGMAHGVKHVARMSNAMAHRKKNKTIDADWIRRTIIIAIELGFSRPIE